MSHVGSGFPIEGVLERQLKSWRLEAVRNGRERESIRQGRMKLRLPWFSEGLQSHSFSLWPPIRPGNIAMPFETSFAPFKVAIPTQSGVFGNKYGTGRILLILNGLRDPGYSHPFARQCLSPV